MQSRRELQSHGEYSTVKNENESSEIPKNSLKVFEMNLKRLCSVIGVIGFLLIIFTIFRYKHDFFNDFQKRKFNYCFSTIENSEKVKIVISQLHSEKIEKETQSSAERI
jgi:hypothetical protein